MRSWLRAVILDLDDTLYAERSYFESGLCAVANFVAGPDEGLRAAWRERLFTDVRENGRVGALDRIPAPPGRLEDGWVATLLQVYRTHRPAIAPFPDVAPFITRTRGERVRIGLVTDGKSCAQRRKIEALGLAGKLDAVICSDDIDAPKPGVESFVAAAALIGAPVEACIYIGDDPSKDFIGPRRLGMETIRLRRPLPHPIAKPAADPAADARHCVASLAEAGDLMFGGTL